MPRKDKVVISMKDKLEYYESIRREYPEVITKDQFYRIAHISKETELRHRQQSKKSPPSGNS